MTEILTRTRSSAYFPLSAHGSHGAHDGVALQRAAPEKGRDVAAAICAMLVPVRDTERAQNLRELVGVARQEDGVMAHADGLHRRQLVVRAQRHDRLLPRAQVERVGEQGDETLSRRVDWLGTRFSLHTLRNTTVGLALFNGLLILPSPLQRGPINVGGQEAVGDDGGGGGANVGHDSDACRLAHPLRCNDAGAAAHRRAPREARDAKRHARPARVAPAQQRRRLRHDG
eukprot:661732-Pleurochrysis_carterae.AAC.4